MRRLFTTETPDTVKHAAILCTNLTSFNILLSRVHQPHREETFINTLPVTLTPKRKGFIIYTTIQPHSVYHFMLTPPPPPPLPLSHTHIQWPRISNMVYGLLKLVYTVTLMGDSPGGV